MAFSPRHGHQRTRSRLHIGIPHYNGTVEEKYLLTGPGRSYQPWFIPISVPLPGASKRALRLWTINPKRTPQWLHRKRGIILLTAVLLCCLLYATIVRSEPGKKKWPTPPWPQPSRGSVVYNDADLRRIWQWEILSGHYPSHRKLPDDLKFTSELTNPAIPPRKIPRDANETFVTTTRGVGPKRVYLDLQSQPPHVAYPLRPVPGSVADLDIILEQCDFSEHKYVRDCLEVLRIGGGLDNGKRVRRGNVDDWNYIYLENELPSMVDQTAIDLASSSPSHDKWEKLALPPIGQYQPYSTIDTQCDTNNPRIFHMFWVGPITDKPYNAIMSFLFTQNTGLNSKVYPSDVRGCRPQFWIWLNQAPASVLPPPTALHDMFNELKDNPWASPFLHPRFKDVIKFKLWNTTEMLDGVPELKDEWRKTDSLFKSGAHVLHVPEPLDQPPVSVSSSVSATTTAAPGPKAPPTDRLSTILSDMARFVLCHRFGGIYLDADILLLRDWEDLWGWKGAFAYRWSFHEKYNTAVLRMHKGSALGTFLFKTALNNGLDFHPMTISVYMSQAYLQGLLYRLPDALFDPAWLTSEGYQRERPPQPYFETFFNFFETPTLQSAAPQALGFNGFFSGAYSYHYHSPWRPFDTSRNFPDLGEPFKRGEMAARKALKVAAGLNATMNTEEEEEEENIDQRDLDWSAVMKRTFEAYVRGERPNMYGEWLAW